MTLVGYDILEFIYTELYLFQCISLKFFQHKYAVTYFKWTAPWIRPSYYHSMQEIS